MTFDNHDIASKKVWTLQYMEKIIGKNKKKHFIKFFFCFYFLKMTKTTNMMTIPIEKSQIIKNVFCCFLSFLFNQLDPPCPKHWAYLK
jgi:hypothetical protein